MTKNQKKNQKNGFSKNHFFNRNVFLEYVSALKGIADRLWNLETVSCAWRDVFSNVILVYKSHKYTYFTTQWLRARAWAFWAVPIIRSSLFSNVVKFKKLTRFSCFRNLIGGYLRAQTELDNKRGLYIMQEDHIFQLEQTRSVFNASEKSCDQCGKNFPKPEFWWTSGAEFIEASLQFLAMVKIRHKRFVPSRSNWGLVHWMTHRNSR